MKTTGVAELEANLSRYLAHAKGGHEVVITERGLPVAKLVPLEGEERRESRRERLSDASLPLGIVALQVAEFDRAGRPAGG
jgi:prevent-host-death family protein